MSVTPSSNRRLGATCWRWERPGVLRYFDRCLRLPQAPPAQAQIISLQKLQGQLQDRAEHSKPWLTITQLGVKNGTTPIKQTFTVSPGREISTDLRPSNYSLQATIGTTTVSLGNVGSSIDTVQLIYIVGSISNNSVSLVTHLIKDVF